MDGQTRDEWIYFKPSHANYGQRRQTYFPEGWHGAEPNRPFVRTKGLVGFVSQISSSPGYIDADRRRNRFPVPAPLQPFQFLSRMIQLLVDHGFIAQQLVQFLFRRQEEMIGDRVYFRATNADNSGSPDSAADDCLIS